MIKINGIDDLDNFIIINSCNIILLYFGATWCKPCQILKTKLNETETRVNMPLLSVCYIDVDLQENQEIVDIYKVSELPTQIFIKLDKTKITEVNRIIGYDFIKLKNNYDSMCNPYI